MSERRGHRKLRLYSKKNYEKKRTEARCQALLAKSCERKPTGSSNDNNENIVSLKVSIPLSYYTDNSVQSLEILHKRLHMIDTINEGMFYICVHYTYSSL